MREKLLLLAVVIIFASSSAVASTTISDISDTRVVPGSSFTVQATIHNTGYEDATYKPLVLDLPEGFEVIERPDRELIGLCADCSVERTFNIRVKEGTPSGSYRLKLEPDPSYDTGFGQEKTFLIVVDGKANLFASMDVPEVMQGGSTEASVKIRNTGTDTASQVSITLSMPDARLNPSKLYLGSLKPGESVVRTVELRASDSIPSGPSEIQIASRYRDEGKIVEKASSSVYIQENAEITVSQVKTGEAFIGSETRVLIELQNTGPGEAEKLSSHLTCKNAEVQDSRAFAGSLDSEESVPTVYRVVPRSEEVKCVVEASYVDSGEEQMKKSFEISASRKRVYMTPLLGGFAVLIAAGIYYWRRKDEN